MASSDNAGSVKDSQIEAAILLAMAVMHGVVTIDKYNEVLGWTQSQLEADAEKMKKWKAYVDAETYFAISKLPPALKNGQMSASGLETRTQVGQASTTFAPVEEGQRISRGWESAAMEALAPYLDIIRKDSAGEDLAFKGRRSGFSIMII